MAAAPSNKGGIRGLAVLREAVVGIGLLLATLILRRGAKKRFSSRSEIKQSSPQTTGRATDRRDWLVIGSFENGVGALDATRALIEEWRGRLEVYSPNLDERFFDVLKLPASSARAWVLAGAILGELGGWVTTIMLSIYWVHRVASMPVIAIPPFAIIAFEVMVLFGASAGLVALLFYCELPAVKPPPEELYRYNQNHVGIVIRCEGNQEAARARRVLEDYGAVDIAFR